MNNANVASVLRRYAAILALEGANRFKVKAYRRAAETLEAAPQNVEDLTNRGELQLLPGIGQAIGGQIHELVTTGKLPQLDRAITKLPSTVLELADKPALDPKQIRRIYKKLGIGSLKELAERLHSGELGRVLGSRAEFHVRRGLDERPRMLLWAAEKMVPRIEDRLKHIRGVTRIARVGSLRRKQDTIGDLNFLVTGGTAATIFKQFGESIDGQVTRVNRHEGTFSLSVGINLHLVSVSQENWAFELLRHTGSASHLRDLKEIAKRKKIEFVPKSFHGSRSAEKTIYTKLGLPFIEPELREGRGEVKAASHDTLPALVTLEDLRGDLHMHTTASDGANSIEEMAEAAVERGYQYIAITDHSQSLKITNGLTVKRLQQQIKQIDRINAKLTKLTILKSAEVDILEDGQLDYPNSVLKELDLTICSIHSRFTQDKQAQTERILRAMDNPYFNILGHATGRLLLRRPGYELDIERIIEHARARGCCFEINSSPNRLDLSDEHAKLAKDAGVKIAINTDAHSIDELRFISAGLNQARRGWLEPADVLNTLPLNRLRKALRRN